MAQVNVTLQSKLRQLVMNRAKRYMRLGHKSTGGRWSEYTRYAPIGVDALVGGAVGYGMAEGADRLGMDVSPMGKAFSAAGGALGYATTGTALRVRSGMALRRMGYQKNLARRVAAGKRVRVPESIQAQGNRMKVDSPERAQAAFTRARTLLEEAGARPDQAAEYARQNPWLGAAGEGIRLPSRKLSILAPYGAAAALAGGHIMASGREDLVNA